MNIKALIEKKNELMNEARSMLKTAETEVRGLDEKETSRQAQLNIEITDLNTKIKEEENRAAAEADSIEKINSQEEKRAMENKLTQEMEVRALEQFIRKTDGEELRAVTTAANPGQITIPTHLSKYMVEKLYERAPIFARTRNFTPVNGFLEILKEGAHGTAGFVGEMTALTPNDFTLTKVKLDQKRVGTAIELSQHLVNDSGIDVVNYAIGMLTKRLGQTIDKNVLDGTGGSDQFEGILTTAITTIDKVTAASGSAITIDELLSLYTSMNPEYIGGAVWVVSRATFNMIAKLKDGNGHYFLVRDVATTGPIYKLFGQEVLIQEGMNNHEAGRGRTVVFANFGEGYATMTKKGLNLQHISGDTTQAMRGSHLLLLDGYMDGKILNEEAIRCLKAPLT